MADYQEEVRSEMSEVEEVSPGQTFELEEGEGVVLGGNPDPAKRPNAKGVRVTNVPESLPGNLLYLKATPTGVTGESLSSSFQITFNKTMQDGTQRQNSLVGNNIPLGANVDLTIMGESGVLRIQDLAKIEDPGEKRRSVLTLDWISRRSAV